MVGLAYHDSYAILETRRAFNNVAAIARRLPAL